MNKSRVVITGCGTINSLGSNPEEFWNNIKNGSCGIDLIRNFDSKDFKVHLASEVSSFSLEEYYSKKEIKRMDRFSQFALYSAHQAVKNAGINFDETPPYRMGTILGTGIGGINEIEDGCKTYNNYGPKISAYFIPKLIPNMAAALISKEFHLKGVCSTITTACASSNQAIGEAFVLLQDNKMDVIITGGTEAAVTPTIVGGFTSMGALSTVNDKLKASIPFDKERKGFVIGEGAGILILERLEHAKARNAKIIAEIVGYVSTCDAYHITSPCPNGEAATEAINRVIKDAKIKPEQISYINAHGTGTYKNDMIETKVIKNVFKDYAYKIPISATKSMTGHLLGASGAIEAIICTKVIEKQFIPPTLGYNTPDDLCDLNYTPNIGHTHNVEYALSNSMAFGGHNAILLFKRYL